MNEGSKHGISLKVLLGSQLEDRHSLIQQAKCKLSMKKSCCDSIAYIIIVIFNRRTEKSNNNFP